MDLNRIRKELAEVAKNNEICEEWLKQLKSVTELDQLLDMYVKGIDFCFSNDFPTNGFIRRNLRGKIEHKHIYLDHTIDLDNVRDLVCLGDTRINYLANQFAVAQLFIKDNCKGRIIVKDSAFVTIDLFGNSEIEVVASESSKVMINVYKGAKVKVSESGNAYVKVSRKDVITYQ